MENQEEIIYLQEGWQRIDAIGIQPFLSRVECFDTDELDTKPNPMQEFLQTYDTVAKFIVDGSPQGDSFFQFSGQGG